MSAKTVEERLNQAEKDIEDITVILRNLLTWKRNQETRSLPTTQYKEQPDKKKEINHVE